MQEAQSLQQSVNVKEKIYYVSKDYIIQEDFTLNSPILIKRNGGGSAEMVDRILKMCGMEVVNKRDDFYILKEKTNG